LTHARDQWLTERQRELLPVAYAHVVFTLPHALAALALHNKRIVYDLLFQASAATLLEVARTPRHLGATLGFLSASSTRGAKRCCIIRTCIVSCRQAVSHATAHSGCRRARRSFCR
jgi:hypothetical protein